jgi:hypothetical protein
MSIQKMKRVMPTEHLKQTERYFTTPAANRSNERTQRAATSSNSVALKRARHQRKSRKHNDSISESKLIKEKLPSSSLATIGKNINVLIPRNNHNILESIDLTTTDGAVLKQLMNNNNGDMNFNGDDFEELNDNELGDDDSDSETVTGDESLFELDDESESEAESIQSGKVQTFKKNMFGCTG